MNNKVVVVVVVVVEKIRVEDVPAWEISVRQHRSSNLFVLLHGRNFNINYCHCVCWKLSSGSCCALESQQGLTASQPHSLGCRALSRHLIPSDLSNQAKLRSGVVGFAYGVDCVHSAPNVLLHRGLQQISLYFANTAVAVAFAVLIFTNTKIFKYLRNQVQQWDDLHDST